jgi:hypothetical protein
MVSAKMNKNAWEMSAMLEVMAGGMWLLSQSDGIIW